jgi:hypothetical protein
MTRVQRQKQGWGTLLTVRPFSAGKFNEMKIEAEIVRPAGGRGTTTTRYSFSRLPIAEKFSPAELIAWIEAQRAILEEGRKESDKKNRVAADLGSRKPKQLKKKKATAKK